MAEISHKEARRSAERRARMVRAQLAERGIHDPLVLAAMGKIPREEFLPGHLADAAYDDRPLPIAGGQTISQPYIVAYMIEALGLKGGEKVLEIGAGSGYAAAVMAEIAGEVFTMERIAALAELAKVNLAAYRNVHVRHGDGTQGWVEEAPFDAILVSAGAPEIPRALKRQLAVGGTLIVPVGAARSVQDLVRIRRVSESQFDVEDLVGVRFVPLIGKNGWQANPESGADGSPAPGPPRRRPEQD